MNAHTPALTPLALENAALLQRLQAQDFTTKAALAADLGRDHANLTRTVGRLADEGWVADWKLTAAGANAVRMIAMLSGDHAAPPTPSIGGVGGHIPSGYISVPHHKVVPDALNPRKHFDEEALAELAESIARDGLLENLVVRLAQPGDTAWILVAGERRWRAIRILIADGRWHADQEIPCRLVDLDEAGHRRVALVENLQRKDLRPIDEAQALKELMDVTGAGTADVAKEIGFTQRFVQQRLQLLDLPEKLREQVNTGDLPIEKAREVAALLPKLPPIKQVELSTGKITLDYAKSWLSQQPVPLSARARLILGELVDAFRARGVGRTVCYYGGTEVQARTERTEVPDSHNRIAVKAEDPAARKELQERYTIEQVRQLHIEQIETGRYYIAGTYAFEQNAKKEIPGIFDDAKRPAILSELRLAAGVAEPDKGKYAIPWLNGPFPMDPAIQQQIDDKVAARKERERKDKEAQAKAAAEAKAKQEAGLKVVANAAAHEADLRNAVAISSAAFSGLVNGLTSEIKLQLPLYMAPDGRIVDAGGTEIIDGQVYEYQLSRGEGADTLAQIRLLVGIVNAAAGLETPADEPVEMDPEAPDRPTFVGWIAEALMEGDDDTTRDEATAQAEAGLASWLTSARMVFGEANHVWDQDSARDLAGDIREDLADQAAETEDED